VICIPLSSPHQLVSSGFSSSDSHQLVPELSLVPGNTIESPCSPRSPTTSTAMKSIALLVAAQLASAHFGLVYPEWRANTLDSENEEYSQWTYPCECP
jgi:hypothetical protein